MINVWVVQNSTLKPLRMGGSFSGPEAALQSAARILRRLGVVEVAVRNLTGWGAQGATSLLVYDHSDLIPFSLVVEGAVITEGSTPLPPTETITSEDDTIVYN